MGETLMKATLIRQEARRVWITVFIGVVLCLCTVALIPSTYAEADDLGAQMILAGEDGFAAAAEVPFFSRTLNYLLFCLYQGPPTWL